MCLVITKSCELSPSLGLGAAAEEDMGLGLVDHVVTPADGLLHAEHAPLGLVHEAAAGDVAGEVLGEDDVAVLKLVVVVLLAVEDLGLQLHDDVAGLLLLHGIRDGEEVNALALHRCYRWLGFSIKYRNCN
eukprot:17550_1